MRGGYHPRSPPLEGDTNVARAAEQPVVVETALAAAVGDGNNVIGFPARTHGPPAFPRGAIPGRRLRARPLAMRLDDVEAAEPARPLVALLHFAAHVPGAAADLPFVHARLPAER